LSTPTTTAPRPPAGPGGLMGGGASLAEATAALRGAARGRSLLRRVTALFTPYRRAVYGVGVLILLSSSSARCSSGSCSNGGCSPAAARTSASCWSYAAR